MATSPMAMTHPTAGAMGTRWTISAWIGLARPDPTSWAWMEVGLEELKNWGSAIFSNPA